MNIKINTDKNVNTDDLDIIFKKIGWGGLRTKESWVKVLERSSFVVSVLIDNYVVGFGRCVDDTDMCMVYDISVHPDYQKQGIGKIVMEEIIKYINQNDFIRVQLFAYDKTIGLNEFYKKFGFESVTTGMCIVGEKLKK